MVDGNITYSIGVLEGEGIGPEVIQATLSLLTAIEEHTSLRFNLSYGGKIGLDAEQESGSVLTPAVIAFCQQIFAEKGAILCGPGGGRFVYDLRKTLNLFYKLVPIQPLSILGPISAVKSERLRDIDILVIRENLGGIYQGEFNLEQVDGHSRATHTFAYDSQQIANIANIALMAAMKRRKKICVMIKSGGAPSMSALWKQVTESVIQGNEVELSFLEIDNAAYQVIANPQQFDVILTPNLFGDILADGAAILLGSRGLSYSANFGVQGEGIYQTGHGAAYDIAQQNRANPLGQIYSLAYLLEQSFGLTDMSHAIHRAVEMTLAQGIRTADIMTAGCIQVSTSEMAEHIAHNLKMILSRQKLPISKDIALLLIDAQESFLQRLDAQQVFQFTQHAEQALNYCRSQNIPIIHVQTKKGYLPIDELKPLLNERVIYKSHYHAFGQTELHELLQTLNINTVVIAGLFTHACVHVAAVEAFERGYQVYILEEAVASYDVSHAEFSRKWLQSRVANFIFINNLKTFIESKTIDLECKKIVDSSVQQAKQAWFNWRLTPRAERKALLTRWKQELILQTDALVSLLCDEINKPKMEAQAEVQRAIAHLDYTLGQNNHDVENVTRIKQCSGGCYAVITPWNNPVAIPVSKIAPALYYGNTVIWKPAEHAPLLAQALLQTLLRAGADEGLVKILTGDKYTARELIQHAHVSAVTITGSIETGRSIAALCHQLEKPLQAELGGNNACIIMDDVDLKTVMTDLVLSAFSFAGQRCTAIRRFIVHINIAEKFEKLLLAEISHLIIGHPHHAQTQMGPLISERQLQRIKREVAAAIAMGARLLCGGQELEGLGQGHWYAPTLLTHVAAHFPIVRQESFGPIAVIQIAHDIEHAVNLANDVPHGLLACLLTDNAAAKTYFEEHIEAGILKFVPGPLQVLPDMPFGGWKASQIGPPEHGEWDKHFYTRPQAIYA